MSLLDKLHSSGAVKHAGLLSDSDFFKQVTRTPTDVPIINAALSGDLMGGLPSGLTFFAGESKNFKTLLGLIMVKSYLKHNPDSICLFYDSEFGSTPSYFESVGIDTSRVFHVPVEHVEQLKFDITKRLEALDREDKIIIFIDSVGNIASKKEIDDALDNKSVADITRAKAMKSLWRIVTPALTTKDIPCVAVNHTYKTLELYSKDVMSGGTGGMYSANQVFVITKAQEKEKEDGKDVLAGYKFTINIEKSRYVKEKSKFPFTVTYNSGINKWSGLFELALEGNFITKISAQKYSRMDPDTGEVEEFSYKRKEIDNKQFWQPILDDPRFNEFVKRKYQLGTGELFEEDKEQLDND